MIRLRSGSLSELEFILEGVQRVGGFHDPSMRHLASPLSVRHYIRIADDTHRRIRGGRVLDWGCGYGQLSYLLSNRGLDVTSYDVGPVIEATRLPVPRPRKVLRGGHPYRLPFRSSAFDAVLACGVLEHVADMEQSLDELRRVLVPHGQLFIFNLPQRWSYKELVLERLQLGYTHERRFTNRSIRTALQGHGFRAVAVHRVGMLPHLATGLPARWRGIYDRASSSLFKADRALSKTPILNWIAQSLEVVAERVELARPRASVGAAL